MAAASALAGEREYPEKSRRWTIAVAVSLAALIEIVDTSIVNVALTQMQASLGATLAEVGWVITSYAIANVIILPLSAWLGERFGQKRFFVFSLVAFVAASMLCGFSRTLPQLVLARVLQGLFGGGLLAKAQSILFETFPKEEQPAAQALFGVVAISGPAIGPTVGGWIVTNLDWRWIFFINLPIGIVAITMSASALMPDRKRALVKARVDWLSLALLAAGLGSLQTLLEEGYSHGWFESRFILAMAVVATLSLIWFVQRQLETDAPVVDLRVLRYRSLAAGCLVSMAIGMGLYGAMFSVPIFAQTVLRFTAQQTGWLMFPGAIASAFSMILVSRLLRHFDPRVLIATGAMIVVGTMISLSKITPLTGTEHLFWPLIIRGFGTVLMFLPMSMAALGSIPVKDVAKATGLYNLTRQLGGSLSIAILTTVLSSRQAFHRAVLVEKVSATDPQVLARLQGMTAQFVAKGFDPVEAKRKALFLIDASVSLQASVLSFGDTFTMTAFVFIGILPLLFLLGGKSKAPVGGGGH